MVKVHIIGNGRWGNILKNNIERLVKFVEPDEADWIIISTPNDLHYEQTKYWLIDDAPPIIVFDFSFTSTK